MKTLTQEELEKRMKNWISNRDEILDFYVKLADEPAKRMIEQTIRRCRHIIPRSIVYKAAERARMKNIKCACGSDQFKAQKICRKHKASYRVPFPYLKLPAILKNPQRVNHCRFNNKK